MRASLLPLLASLALLAGCQSSIDVTHYDQSCTVDADCAPVFSGELCTLCGGCANTAINVSAEAQYKRDAAALRGLCPPYLGPVPACSPCQFPTAVCASGTCTVALGP